MNRVQAINCYILGGRNAVMLFVSVFTNFSEDTTKTGN